MVINQSDGTIVINKNLYSEEDIEKIRAIVYKKKGRKLIIVSSTEEEGKYK
jgi:hypothetical protein